MGNTDTKASGRSRVLAIIALAFVVMIANNGFIIAGLTAFDTPMLHDLHISVGTLKIRDTVTVLTLGLTVWVAGYLIDRFRVVPVVVTGLATMTVGFITYRFVRTPIELYLVHILLGASEALCGVVAHVVLISRWTGPNRGLALGTLVAGSSLGNAILPAFNAWLLVSMPWRDAILAGGVVSAVLIPLVAVVYREWPPAINRAETDCETKIEIPVAQASSFRSAYSSMSFWLLSATAATTVFCVLGISTNLALYVQRTLQGSIGHACVLLFDLFIGAVGAQIVAGWVADRVGPARVHTLVVALMAAGALILGFLPGVSPTLAVIMFGIGWGGNSAMLQLRPAALFAGPAIGRTLAALAIVETVGGSIGPSVTGYFYDRTGNYAESFALVGIVAVFALVCIALTHGKPTLPSLPEDAVVVSMPKG